MAADLGDPPTDTDVEEALDALLAALEELKLQSRSVTRRAGVIRRQRRKGVGFVDIVQAEEPPLIVETVRDMTASLVDAFGRFQRAEARALYAEGMSMDRIGRLFGVSRQRVADFLRSRRD